tara:strand:- start:425 stop:1162 length:738 start_codon:yes stop_codon:yes gene_type:complete
MKERLTHVEELELLKEYQTTGSKSSMRRLVTGNVGLVHKIVSKFPMRSSSCSYDDLYQEGVLGLIHGIEKFEATRGCRLSTYCYNWISAYVRRCYQNSGKNVRIPVHVSDKQMKLNKQVESLTNDLGRTPTIEEIEEVNQSAKALNDSIVNCVSLNVLIGDNSELEDLQGEDKTEEFDTIVDCEILLHQLKEIVSPRDYNILIKRYGLDGKGSRTLNELADEYEITRSRCHQIEGILINQLRELV